MILDQKQVIDIIEKGTDPRIKLAQKRAKEINMHYTGKNVIDFLEKLDPYENNAQRLLREKLVKSNRSLVTFLLRPLDKIFTAKGGSVQYNLPSQTLEKFKAQISDVADGLDIKKYLKKVVRPHFVIDPNAVLFIDISPSGMAETHVVNTDKLLWYEARGNSVEAIIFAPFQKEEDKGTKKQGYKYYRVIDAQTDRIFVQDGKDIYESRNETLDNYFGFVPARILGDEKNPNEDIFESFISDIVGDADKYLRDASIANIHDLAHLYPKYWSYAQACTKCEGEGEIRSEDDEGVVKSSTCSSCNGTGVKSRTNPSDEMVIPVPAEGENSIAPHVAGFVSPDLETSRFYYDRAERTKNNMFQAIWGTTYEQGGKRETATGRFLDAQPVQDRLKDTSHTFANLHKFMLDCYGKVLLGNPQYSSSVSYGTRYILEGPDDILKAYMEASRENISELGIIDLRNRYFESEYQGDSVELMKRKKLSRIEPFPTLKSTEVASMEIPDEDKLMKIYYSTWVNTLSDEQIIFLSEQELRASLKSYIAGKKIVKPIVKPTLN